MQEEPLPPPPGDQLFEHAACGLLATDARGVILRINSTACRWLGYQAGELVGHKRLQDLLTIGGRLFHQTHCQPILQLQGSLAEMQLDMQHRDGTRVPVLMNVARSMLEGRVVDSFAIIIAKDRRAYERELLKARRRLKRRSKNGAVSKCSCRR